MFDFDMFITFGVYLLALFFGTHYIRTVFSKRYEAVTFECSSAALLLSFLVMLRCGCSRPLFWLVLALLLGFVGNAWSQWFFYLRLQDIIREKFKQKADCLKDLSGEEDCYAKKSEAISGNLQVMASVAIAPSFSRFIEESKMFNNPAGFIGLLKSLMKRMRFHKRKYLIRECFAENVNLIGPCKPTVSAMMQDQTPENVVPGAIHAGDLALGKRDEILGLLSFDVLGFGALIAIWVFFSCQKELLSGTKTGASGWMLLLLLPAFSALSFALRHYAFARSESFWYELSFSSLVAASFEFVTRLLSPGELPRAAWVSGLVLALFLAASFAYFTADSALHKMYRKFFSAVISLIPPVSETNCAKRQFLRNLQIVSEWAIVPFPGRGWGKRKRPLDFESRKLRDRLRVFEEINENKQNMRRRMEDLVDQIAPGWRSDKLLEKDQNRAVKSSAEFADREKTEKKIRRAKFLMTAFGILSLAAAVFVCVF